MTRPSAKARAISEACIPLPESASVNLIARIEGERNDMAETIDAHLADVREAIDALKAKINRMGPTEYEGGLPLTEAYHRLAAMTPEATP